MLVLNRKERETILIPQAGITITIVRTESRCVRIGIDAPKELEIYRGEVLLRKELPPPSDVRESREPVRRSRRT